MSFSNRATTAAPDGGFGWVVVFAAFMQHVIALGISYTLGVYYPSFIETFQVPSSTAAWVASLHLCMLFGIGPLAGWLMERIGTSGVSFLGSIVAGLGCIGAAFSSSIYLVIASLGLVCGMGTGFMFISSVTAVSRWFDKKRALATGLAVSGAGFGIFLCAPLVRLLLTLYGHQGALLLEGGLALQGCVFALLLRPIPNRSRRSVRSQNGKTNMQIYAKKVAGSTNEEENIPMKPENILTAHNVDKPGAEMTMKNVIHNWIFWVFAVNQLLTFLSASGPLVYLYSRAVGDLAVEPMEASYIISFMGGANTLGRLLFGALANKYPGSRLYLLSGAIATFGLATALSVLGTSYWSVSLFAVIFGAAYGCMFALTTVVLVDLFGIKLFGSVYGNIGLFRGFACLVGPPFAGWLKSVTGDNHTVLFITKGFIGFAGGAVLLLIPVVRRLNQNRKALMDFI